MILKSVMLDPILILWALVQPVVTVVMYFIVFDVVFDTRSQMVAVG